MAVGGHGTSERSAYSRRWLRKYRQRARRAERVSARLIVPEASDRPVSASGLAGIETALGVLDETDLDPGDAAIGEERRRDSRDHQLEQVACRLAGVRRAYQFDA